MKSCRESCYSIIFYIFSIIFSTVFLEIAYLAEILLIFDLQKVKNCEITLYPVYVKVKEKRFCALLYLPSSLLVKVEYI